MELYISDSVHGETGLLSIIGRCGDEPIRPGVEFHAILKERPRQFPDGLELPQVIEKCRGIQIKVQELEAYGKKVDILPPHTTGVLRCVDYSVDLVPSGWILTDRCVSSNV